MSRHDDNDTLNSALLSREQVEQLLHILRAQRQGYDQLLACLGQKREALRAASIDGIRTCCDQERSILAAIRDLELRRQRMFIGRNPNAGRSVAPPRSELTWRCERSEDGDELRCVASDLRGRVERVRRESSVIRAAAEALGRHVAGILQTVAGSFTSARVYSRRGRMNVGHSGRLAVDLKS